MKSRWTVQLPDAVYSVAESPDGARVFVATLDGSVTALDAGDGSVAWQRRVHEGGALALNVSPIGELVVSGGQDGRAVAHDLRDGTPRWERALGTGWLNAVRWSADGALVGVAAGRSVHFLDVEGNASGAPIEHVSTVTVLLVHPTIGWVSTCYGGALVLVPGRAAPVRRLPFRGSVLAASASPDGRYLAGGSQDSSVRLWDLATRHDTSLTGYPGKVRALAWSGNNAWLATGGGDAVVLWRCDGPTVMGTIPMRLSRHAARVSGVAFGRNPDTLLSAGEDGCVVAWRLDIDEGPVVTEVIETGVPLTALWRSGDGDRMWASDRGARLHALSLDTAKGA